MEAAIDPDLALWYKFDEASGTVVADSSGHGSDGTLHDTGIGAAAFSPIHEVGSGSLNLMGYGPSGGGYLAVPSSLGEVAPGAATIAVWVNLRTDQAWARVLDFAADQTAYTFLATHSLVQRTGQVESVQFRITTGGDSGSELIESGTLLSLNVWHHLAVVLPVGTPYIGSLYIDGALAGTNSAMTVHPADLGATTNNWLGRSTYSTADPYFDGMLDDFRVYKRALSPTEIVALHAGSPSGPPASDVPGQTAAAGRRLTSPIPGSD